VPFEDLDADDAAESWPSASRSTGASARLRAGSRRSSTPTPIRYFRLGPAPLAPVPDRPLAPSSRSRSPPRSSARGRASDPSLRHITLTFPPVSLFLERFRAVLRRRGRFVFDKEVEALTRVEQAVAFLALLELRKAGEIAIGQAAPFEEITVWNNAA
jgi:hypothetical protein